MRPNGIAVAETKTTTRETQHTRPVRQGLRTVPALRPGATRPPGVADHRPPEARATRASPDALRALGVAVLAWGVLLTGLLTAGSASAQTENDDGSLILWEATLTVGEGTDGELGYSTSVISTFGSLSVDSFNYAGSTRTVARVNEISTGGELFLEITPKLDDITNATLHVGSDTFAVADAGTSTATILAWSSAPSWSKDDTITVKITQAQPPSAPRNLRAKGVSTTQIDLSWDAPEKTGGSDVTGYKIEVSEDGVSGWVELVESQEGTTYTHMPLAADTMRYYRVSAINDVGTGFASGVALGRTASIPSSGTFTPREHSDGSLTLWEATLEVGEGMAGALGYSTGVTATFGSLSVDSFNYAGSTRTVARVNEISSGGELFLEITPKLDDITNATLHVGSDTFAVADVGTNTATILAWSSAPSWSNGDTITVKITQLRPPSAPQNLSAKDKSATEISLVWGGPSKNGGSAITGFKIEASADGINWTTLVADTMSRTAQYRHEGLTSGDMRHYRVSAINDVGTGPASNEAVGTTEDTAPGLKDAPLGGVDGAHNDLVHLLFDEDFKRNITPDKSAFTVKIEGTVRALDRIKVVGTGVQLWLDSPFRPGETGTVSYTKPATNPLQDAAGNESASFTNVPGVNLLEPIAPDAPTNLHAKGVSTTQIDLSWSGPAYNGGADIMGYTIEVSADRGLTWTEVVASQTATTYSHTVDASGALLYFRVSAFNAAGNGVWSRTASAIAGDTGPGVVSAEIGNPNDKIVTLFFDEALVSNSTPPASAFTVKFGGKARTPRTATIRTSPDRVRLVLAAADAVKPGERVTVSYTKPPTNRLEDAEGEETVSFTDFRVANELPTDFPELLVHDEEVHESGDGTDVTMTFTVSVDKEPDFPVGVHYETEDVTATGGDPTDKGSLKRSERSTDPEDIECDDFRSLPDYISTSGRLTFGPGETSHEVEVTVCDDGTEDSSETFRLVLRSTQLHEPISALGEIGPNGKGYGDEVTASETGTILNEETTTEVSIVADADLRGGRDRSGVHAAPRRRCGRSPDGAGVGRRGRGGAGHAGAGERDVRGGVASGGASGSDRRRRRERGRQHGDGDGGGRVYLAARAGCDLGGGDGARQRCGAGDVGVGGGGDGVVGGHDGGRVRAAVDWRGHGGAVLEPGGPRGASSDAAVVRPVGAQAETRLRRRARRCGVADAASRRRVGGVPGEQRRRFELHAGGCGHLLE